MENNSKKIKENISISLHSDILSLVEKYCKENNIKKSKFIEDVVKEYLKKLNTLDD